ncbi:MAG: hypothetical protein AAFY15_17070, partial [Cyanobacteria bacterium J06648_11]
MARDRRQNPEQRRSPWLSISTLMLLVSCGDPNVPLTRPPSGAFRTEPQATQPRSSPGSISTAALPERSEAAISAAIFDGTSAPSLASLTANFLGLPWALKTRPQPTSVLALAARYWSLPWPPRRAVTPAAIVSPSGSAPPDSPASAPPDSAEDASAPNLTREVPTIPLLPSEEST